MPGGVRAGGPKNVPPGSAPCWPKRDGFYSVFNVDLLGVGGVVVPPKLRDVVLRLVQASHIVHNGPITRSLGRWPAVSKRAEAIARSGEEGQRTGGASRRLGPSSWPPPPAPWQRVHRDALGPHLGQFCCCDN